jgi:hypothetical protein
VKRFAAVAPGILLIRGQFRKRFSQRWKVKHGIVPKSTAAARRFGNLAVHFV